MALPKNYIGLEATQLHQDDFIPEYNKLKTQYTKDNPDLSSQKIHKKIYSKIGYPHWNTQTLEAGKPGTKGFEPYLINQGKPRVAGTRQTSNGIASAKRDVAYELSNRHISPELQAEWTNLQKKFNSRGLQLDHINEIQETGPALETLDKWKKKGFITDAEYQKDKKLIQKAAGNDPRTNAQGLTAQENSAKRTEVIKKNKSLETLERRKLSNRFNLGKFKNKTFEQIYASVKDALKINGNGNDNGNGLKINGGKTQAGALALERSTNPLKIAQTAANWSQGAMRNLSLLNMVSEALTKKKFTNHVGDTAKKGYDNFQLTINNPEQRAKDIKEQQEKLKAQTNYNDKLKQLLINKGPTEGRRRA